MELANIIKIVFIAVGVLLLFSQNIINRDKKERNKQEKNIILGIVLLGIYFILNNVFIVNNYYQGEINLLEILLKNLILIWIIIGVYFIAKLILRMISKESNITEYYEYDNEKKEYFLKSRFKIVGEIFGILAILFASVTVFIVGLLIYLIFKFKQYYMLEKLLIAVVGLPLVYLLLNEIHSFLDGNVKEEEKRIKKKKKEEEENKDKKTEYEELYNEYKNIWGVNLLASSKILNPSTENINVEDENKKIIKDSKNKEVEAIYEKLKLKYKIEPTTLTILNNLLNGENRIIENSNYEELAPILFSYFEDSIIKGKKILVLAEDDLYNNFKNRKNLYEWFVNWFNILYKKSIRNIVVFDEWKSKNEWDILIATQTELIRYQEEFINKIQEEQNDIKDLIILVINEKAEEIAENILTLSILSNILNTYFNVDKKRNFDGAQYIILSSKTSNLKESVNKNLGITAQGEKIKEKLAENIYTLIWKEDSKNEYYTEILNGGLLHELGVGATLSFLAWEKGNEKVEFVEQNSLPYNVYAKEIEVAREKLKDIPINKNNINGAYEYFANYNLISSLIKKEDKKILFIQDNNYNFPLLINNYKSVAGKELLLNIISPVYLLRDYFVENVEYFYSSPLYGYTPKIESDKFKIASYLKEILINEKLNISESVIKEQLSNIKEKLGNIEEELIKLFLDVYNIDILKNDYLSVKIVQEYNNEFKRFEEVKYYKMKASFNENSYFKWFENYEILDTGNNIYKILPYDHIYQNYLPEQIHSFNGDSFVIEKIDTINKKIRISPTENTKVYRYRNKEKIVIEELLKMTEEKYPAKEADKYILETKTISAKYDIETLGYYSFNKGIKFKDQGYKFINFGDNSNLYRRSYDSGKILSIILKTKNNFIENREKISLTLMVILNEILKTLFPGNCKYIKGFVLTGDFLEEEITAAKYTMDNHLSHIVPYQINIEKNDYTNLVEITEDNSINLFFMEDSHKDVGVIKAIMDNFEDILKVVQDYLNWLLEETTIEKSGWEKTKILQNNRLDYLKYGFEEVSEHLDIEGTKEFLNHILGRNEHTEARKRFYSKISETVEEDEFDRIYNKMKEEI